MTLTTDKITALAPDQASLKAANKLMKPAKWPTLLEDQTLVWGECQGSGANPYRTVFDKTDHGYKCTCPSRKFPCKHVLALMWMYVEDPGPFSDGAVPEWVTDWLGRRKKTVSATAVPVVSAAGKSLADARRDEPEAAPDPKAEARKTAAAEKRAKETEAALLGAVADLEQWLEDQLRGGLGAFLNEATERCRTIAARLVDGKAQGLASRLDEMPAGLLARPSEARLDALIQELGRIVLIGRAFTASPKDPELRRLVATSETREAVLESADAPRQRATWEVVGEQVSTRRDGLVSQATWLMNLGEGRRFALLLDFFPASLGKRTSAFLVGERFEAEVAYYPARVPLRAVLAERGGDTPGARDWPAPDGCPLAGYRAALGQAPWISPLPLRLPRAPLRLLETRSGGWPPMARYACRWPWMYRITWRGSHCPGRSGFGTGSPSRSLLASPNGETFTMTRDLVAALSQIKGRWMIGGSAIEAAPESWRAAIDGDQAPDAALLALAGQASQIALRPEPGGRLKTLPPLPALALPSLPASVRPTFRRMLATKSIAEDQIPAILHLFAARGYAVHPVDHMPKAFARLPDVYAPWANWTESTPARDGDVLTEDNWDHWMPAERRIALRKIRSADPAAARALIEARAQDLAAEQRVQVVAILANRLSDADAPYLQSLGSDRSGKVKAVAARLLARLGLTEDAGEDAAELAAFFTVARKGILKRSNAIRSVPMKTNAQRARRQALFMGVGLASFGQALGGFDQVALVEAWDSSEAEHWFVPMVAETGSDAAVAALLARAKTFTTRALVPLATRLAGPERRDLLAQIVRTDDIMFDATLAVAGLARDEDQAGAPDNVIAGALPLTLFEQSTGYVRLIRAVRDQKDDVRHAHMHTVKQGLYTLGLLLDRDGAAMLLQRLGNAGMFAADPALALLTLNAALAPTDTGVPS